MVLPGLCAGDGPMVLPGLCAADGPMVLPDLQALDAAQHVDVSRRVLLDHIQWSYPVCVLETDQWSYLICRLLMRLSMSMCPTEYCSITSNGPTWSVCWRRTNGPTWSLETDQWSYLVCVLETDQWSYLVSGDGPMVLPDLQALDATQHVDVSRRVLLDHILHVVRTERLFELSARHKVLDLADRPDRLLVHAGELRDAIRVVHLVWITRAPDHFADRSRRVRKCTGISIKI